MNIRAILVAQRNRFLFLARYIGAGLTGGAIQILFLFVWVSVLGFERTYLLGLVLGFIVALIVTFLLQKYWAFRDTEPSRTNQQLLYYTAIAISGLALNAGLLAGAKVVFEYFSLNFFNGWYLIVQIVVIGIVSVFNFIMNFLFTFQHARQQRLWNK